MPLRRLVHRISVPDEGIITHGAIVFRLGEAFYNFLLKEEAGELIAPAVIWGSAALTACNMPVTDVDAAAAQLRAAGIVVLNCPTERP